MRNTFEIKKGLASPGNIIDKARTLVPRLGPGRELPWGDPQQVRQISPDNDVNHAMAAGRSFKI